MSASELFHIQELCDRIASHVKLDESPQDDLKSLALVSQTLCTSAQAQIFRHVSLDPWDSETGRLSTNGASLPIPISAGQRLSAVLAASPHLLPHIRSLSVLALIEILELVLKMQLPLVKKIAFNFLLTRGSDDRLLRLTQDIIGLATIREVEIHQLSMGSWLYRELPLKVFPSLFQTFSPDIHTLVFTDITATPALPTTSAPCPPERRAKIRRLQLCQAAPLIEWFISPSCPFDFTHLVEADTDGRKADFLRVLNSARSSIRRLRMTESLASLVDLSDFPALTHLEIQGSYYETVGTLKPDNCVEAIVFHFRADSFLTNRHSGLYASVDAFVSTFSLPVLRQVEVQMRGSFYGPRTAMEHTLQCLPQYFPHLAGRGLLVITDYSLCEPNRLPPARPAHLMGDEGGLWRT